MHGHASPHPSVAGHYRYHPWHTSARNQWTIVNKHHRWIIFRQSFARRHGTHIPVGDLYSMNYTRGGVLRRGRHRQQRRDHRLRLWYTLTDPLSHQFDLIRFSKPLHYVTAFLFLQPKSVVFHKNRLYMMLLVDIFFGLANLLEVIVDKSKEIHFVPFLSRF